MKIKTINKIIRMNLEKWLMSITDPELRKDVRINYVLSGGSITSLLLQEAVNDYDIYIQDQDVLYRLAQYYVKDTRVLIGDNKEEYLKEFKHFEDDTIEDNMAEAVVRIKSLKPGQIKLDLGGAGYSIDYADPNKIPNGLKVLPKEYPYCPVFLSQNAISLSDDIQIVLRFSGTVEEIHKTYDFIHATNYFTHKEGLVTNTQALECILTRELKYQGSLYPLTSIIRMKKFIGRGWTMNAGEVLKMMFQVSELDLKDPVILEEQLVGIDIAYFSKLIELLRDVKRDTITPGYFNDLIDKVFNRFNDED